MSTVMPHPWGSTRVTAFDPSARTGIPHVELDAETQMGRYFDPAGQPIQAGKHGTNRETNKPTTTSGPDGKQPSKDTDNTIDYASD